MLEYCVDPSWWDPLSGRNLRFDFLCLHEGFGWKCNQEVSAEYDLWQTSRIAPWPLSLSRIGYFLCWGQQFSSVLRFRASWPSFFFAMSMERTEVTRPDARYLVGLSLLVDGLSLRIASGKEELRKTVPNSRPVQYTPPLWCKEQKVLRNWYNYWLISSPRGYLRLFQERRSDRPTQLKDRNSRVVYWRGKQSWCLAAETNLESGCGVNIEQDWSQGDLGVRCSRFPVSGGRRITGSDTASTPELLSAVGLQKKA